MIADSGGSGGSPVAIGTGDGFGVSLVAGGSDLNLLQRSNRGQNGAIWRSLERATADFAEFSLRDAGWPTSGASVGRRATQNDSHEKSNEFDSVRSCEFGTRKALAIFSQYPTSYSGRFLQNFSLIHATVDFEANFPKLGQRATVGFIVLYCNC